MREHAYSLTADTARFHVEVSPSTNYGWFEHKVYGDERGGGLWFQFNRKSVATRKVELIDFDGMAYLPTEVANQLREWGFEVGTEYVNETA